MGCFGEKTIRAWERACQPGQAGETRARRVGLDSDREEFVVNVAKVAFRRARMELHGMGRIIVVDDKYSIVGRKIEIEEIGTDGTKTVQQGNLYPTPNHDGNGTTGTHSFRSVPCVPPNEGSGYE